MSRKQFHFTFLATCMIGMLSGAHAWAADITLAGKPMPAHQVKAEPDALPRMSSMKSTETRRVAQAERTKRERLRQRGIVTYNLFHDPAFKLAGAVSDLRQLQPAPGFGVLAPAAGAGSSLSHLPRAASAAAALKMDAAAMDAAGIAFDCSEKSSSPFRRGVTACYKARLDKSWKTQTYISKGFVDGDPEWGGGLSITYAH